MPASAPIDAKLTLRSSECSTPVRSERASRHFHQRSGEKDDLRDTHRPRADLHDFWYAMALTLRRAMTVVVVAHLAANIGHGVAHASLGVKASGPDTVFIVLVIVAAPVVAAVLWTKEQRRGAWLLLGSMSAAAVFGVYGHYLTISPDHVDHLPKGDLQPLFRLSAASLVWLELAGVTVGILGIAWGKKDG
jgi:hypothetical protein